MIDFNTQAGAEARSKTKPLTLEQEQEAVNIINALIIFTRQKKTDTEGLDEQLLQDFVNNYQNLNHHKAVTCGLWATDQPDKVIDNEKLLFQISY